MSVRLGLNAKLYYGPAGAIGATELKNVKDLTLNLETGEADITTRAAEGWRVTIATLKDGSVEFEMIWDTQDLGFKAIKTAFFTNTAIALAVLDGPNGSGLDADFTITKFTRAEPLEESLKVQVTAKPMFVSRAPVWKDADPTPPPTP